MDEKLAFSMQTTQNLRNKVKSKLQIAKMSHFGVQKFKNQILGENQKIRSHFSGPTFIAKRLKKKLGVYLKK